ncbi:MAG: fluoride efflux transporter CrcB [Pigmentiphaga sp.]
MRAIDVMWVGVGGGLGSLLRWQLGHLIESRIKMRFPLGTYVINVSGAFVIAYLSAAYAIEWQQRHGDLLAALVLTGVLGGYTTFSSMQLDTVQLVEDKRPWLAVFYLVSSIGAGLVAAVIGVALATG